MRRTVRAAAHVVLAILGWLGFGWMWWYVFATQRPTVQQYSQFALLVVFSACVVLATLAWVRYNVGIYQRKGSRTHVPAVARDFSVDVTGMPVRAAFGQLRDARYIVIGTAEEDDVVVKTYAVGSDELTPAEVAACEL